MTIAIIAGILVILAAVCYVLLSNSGGTTPEADARRFAGLLISEIKLYENQKVQQGLKNNNLYEILHDRIEGALKMYRKKVSNPDFERFFDEALVEILADGDRNKLGKTGSPQIQ